MQQLSELCVTIVILLSAASKYFAAPVILCGKHFDETFNYDRFGFSEISRFGFDFYFKQKKNVISLEGNACQLQTDANGICKKMF